MKIYRFDFMETLISFCIWFRLWFVLVGTDVLHCNVVHGGGGVVKRAIKIWVDDRKQVMHVFSGNRRLHLADYVLLLCIVFDGALRIILHCIHCSPWQNLFRKIMDSLNIYIWNFANRMSDRLDCLLLCFIHSGVHSLLSITSGLRWFFGGFQLFDWN